MDLILIWRRLHKGISIIITVIVPALLSAIKKKSIKYVIKALQFYKPIDHL
jgi:hypothetical protein